MQASNGKEDEFGLEKKYVEFGPEFTGLMNKHRVPIEFPYLVDTSKYMPTGQPLVVPGIELNANVPMRSIVDNMYYMCGLPIGGNIQVIGGASGFNLDGIPSLDELIKGIDGRSDLPDSFYYALDIYRVAYTLKANMITGGTQSGVMAVLSSIWLADQVFNEEILHSLSKKTRLLDISQTSIVSLKSPALIHIVPDSEVIYPGNPQVSDKFRYPLAPCTCFFSASGNNSWGGDGVLLEKSAFATSFIPQADDAISSLPYMRGYFSQHRVSVIMNGGYLSLREAKMAASARRPSKILVLEGTGRFADLLAASIKNKYCIPDDDHPVWQKKSVLVDYSRADYAVQLNELLALFKNQALQESPIAFVHTAGNEGLTSKIESLMTGHRM